MVMMMMMVMVMMVSHDVSPSAGIDRSGLKRLAIVLFDLYNYRR